MSNHSDVDLVLYDDSKLEALLDPSTKDGYTVIYSSEVPLDVRTQTDDDTSPVNGTMETIQVKILTCGESATTVRVELTSEVDLFFHYTHTMDQRSFDLIQGRQRLMVSFSEYHNVLIRMFNSATREPNTHLAILVLSGERYGRLDFVQNMEYKFIELMTFDCESSTEEVVQHHITYRYNAMKQRLLQMQNRLQGINNFVKLKNPSLLLQLQSQNQNQNLQRFAARSRTPGSVF